MKFTLEYYCKSHILKFVTTSQVVQELILVDTQDRWHSTLHILQTEWLKYMPLTNDSKGSVNTLCAYRNKNLSLYGSSNS